MASNIASIPIKSVLKNATLNVRLTGVKRWRVRLWIGMRLIRLAAWIMWMNIEISGPEKDEHEIAERPNSSHT